MKALQVLKYHVQQTDSLNFTERTSQKEKKAEIEKKVLNSKTVSDNLKNTFPNTQAKERPEYFYKGIPDPF